MDGGNKSEFDCSKPTPHHNAENFGPEGQFYRVVHDLLSPARYVSFPIFATKDPPWARRSGACNNSALDFWAEEPFAFGPRFLETGVSLVLPCYRAWSIIVMMDGTSIGNHFPSTDVWAHHRVSVRRTKQAHSNPPTSSGRPLPKCCFRCVPGRANGPYWVNWPNQSGGSSWCVRTISTLS